MSSAPPVRRVVLVLGMHRGGTSALSHAVHLLGASAPATPMPPGPDNPRGFWESAAVASLDDEILAAGGSGWADWRRFEPARIPAAARARLEDRMAAVLDHEFAGASLLVLKDPRLSRLLPVWQPVLARLAVAPCALLALRHPAAVARSLARRNGFPPALSVLLWLRHMLDAERDTRGLPRAVVSFEALQRDWRATLLRAGGRLELSWPRPPHDVDTDFLDPRPPDPEAGPQTGSAYAEVWARHAWQALRALERGEAAEGVLDQVRQQFEDACGLFSAATPPAGPPVPPRPGPDTAQPAAPAPATPPQTTARQVVPRTARPPRPSLGAVTLCAADSSRVDLTVRALGLCVAQCDFADALLFSDRTPACPVRVQPIARLASRADYSAFLLDGLVHHVRTSHALVVQWDGYVVDPQAWDDAFLGYDYIGARWGWHAPGSDVGNGGFSLRSRRLLEALQHPRFRQCDGQEHAAPEDELICRLWRPVLEREHAIRFAPAAVADRFAHERTPPHGPSFGFHGLFNLWRHLDDAALAAVLPLLPPDARRGREFAELAAMCILHRPASLGALASAWHDVQPAEKIRAALAAVLAPADFAAGLHAMGVSPGDTGAGFEAHP